MFLLKNLQCLLVTCRMCGCMCGVQASPACLILISGLVHTCLSQSPAHPKSQPQAARPQMCVQGRMMCCSPPRTPEIRPSVAHAQRPHLSGTEGLPVLLLPPVHPLVYPLPPHRHPNLKFSLPGSLPASSFSPGPPAPVSTLEHRLRPAPSPHTQQFPPCPYLWHTAAFMEIPPFHVLSKGDNRASLPTPIVPSTQESLVLCKCH